MLEVAFKHIPRERIYEITGLQFLPVQHGIPAFGDESVAIAVTRCCRDITNDARSLWLALDWTKSQRAD